MMRLVAFRRVGYSPRRLHARFLASQTPIDGSTQEEDLHAKFAKFREPGDDARHVAEVFPELLSKEAVEEFKSRNMADKLLRFKLKKLHERMIPKPEEEIPVLIDASNIYFTENNLVCLIWVYHILGSDRSLVPSK